LGPSNAAEIVASTSLAAGDDDFIDRGIIVGEWVSRVQRFWSKGRCTPSIGKETGVRVGG